MNRKIEDIDQLFREGLNPVEDQFPLPKGDWQKMEQRLNRYDQRKRGIFWLTRLGSVAAVLLLFFVLRTLFTVDHQEVIQPIKVQQKEQPSAAKKQQEQPQNEPLRPEHNKKEISQNNQSTDKQRVEYTVKMPARKKVLAEKLSVTGPVAGMPKSKMTEKDSLTEESFLMNKKSIPVPTIISKEEKPPLLESEMVLEEKLSTTKETVLVTTEEPDIQSRAERSGHKMVLSVMAAPAYNGVNNLNNGSVGNDFGLLVSYEIARNWYVSTGGIYAKKLYDMGFRKYHPQNNIWKEYYPESVHADCRVLDIPVNLSYTFIKGKGRTISAGSGISSYLMLKENYHFSYAETDPQNPLSYEIVNENRHWLSVLNFQATIEQRLSKRLSISLQPYLKLPLGTIGFAGVKLQSLGMAANLNWNFSL